MKLVVGLGNPGAEYRSTRHSVGFDVVDRLCERHRASLQQKFKGELGRADIAGEPCILLKPLTYMNRSGISVGLTREYFHVEPADIIVVHDEADLPFGRLRVKDGGGHAGHNGLRSIVESIGSAAFARVRVGVGKPERGDLADHVLSRWSPEEREWLTDLLDRSADAVTEVVAKGVKAAMNRFNAAPAEGAR